MALHLPDPQALDDDRVAAAIGDLGFPIPDGPAGWSAPIRAAAAWVQEVPGEPVRTFSVRDDRVRHRSGPIAVGSLVCSCGGRTCAHVGAVLLVLAWNDPGRRARVEAPAWEAALDRLAPDLQEPVPGPAGHLRWTVRAPAAGQPGLWVELAVIHAGPDGERVGRAPRDLDALRAAVDRLAPHDLEAFVTAQALDQARRWERQRAPLVTRRLSRALLGPLSEAADLRFEGVPIRASTEEVAPRLVASGAPGQALALAWEPVARRVWPDAGIVLGADGVLRPLAESVAPSTAARLGDPLPPVPPGDVARFVDRMVVDRRLPIALPPAIDPVKPAELRVARLALAEVQGDLEVRLDLAYRRDGLDGVARPGALGTTLRVPGAGPVRRDPEWERAEAARFRHDTGADASCVLRLTGDAALDFLTERLPALATRWEVHGEDRLLRWRVRGALTPTVRFAEGQDWFDVDVAFTLGGRSVPAPEVLAGWLRGDRTVRLDDGSLATLPTAWLERHGRTLDTLAEVRRAQRKLGSWHAWTASDLLAEAGGPAERWLGWVRAADRRDGVARRPPPPGLRATLRPYQQSGFEWLCFLRDHGLHGVLADEMGLGKTVQALAVLLDGPRDAPSLVVAPTSVLHGWLDAAARFAPDLPVVAWHGAGRREALLDRPGLVVTTYALLRRDADRLAARTWSWVVLDEGQQIKNPASQTARAARKLSARHRLVLTGTPLENDLLELWSLFQFLMPGYLGRRSAFHARYAAAGRQGGGPALDELAARIRPFLLRRRKAEVAAELPPRTEVTLKIPLSPKERRLYEAVRSTVRESLLGLSDDPARRRTPLLLEGLTRLRQACCHPALLPFPEARAAPRSSKLEALLAHLEEAVPTGARVLVFSQWVRLLDEVAAALNARGTTFSRLDGSTRDRGAVVAGFQADDGPRVLLISIKAGGTGLNLTAADTVFLLDPWWNPAVEAQATDRAHRIGQTRPVTIYRLVAADTVEDRVLALQARKRELFERTVDQGALDVSALSPADLEALL